MRLPPLYVLCVCVTLFSIRICSGDVLCTDVIKYLPVYLLTGQVSESVLTE